MAAWLGFVAFGLLKDHAAAWVLFGALFFGGLEAAELLSQPAPPDQASGWAVVVLVALAATALVAGRRERAEAEPLATSAPEPVPLPPVEP
jgi:hypothetical protein